MILYPKRNSIAGFALVSFWRRPRFGKHQYGTPRRWLDEAQCKGWTWCSEIDVQGAEQVKQKLPHAVGDLHSSAREGRAGTALRARGQDSEEAIGEAGTGPEEFSVTRSMIFSWINDDVERAGREIQADHGCRAMSSQLLERARTKNIGIFRRITIS